MRQINFLVIFGICLALVLFSLENTEPTVVKIVQGVQVQAPLCVELILAMGLGAVLAWIFSIWARLQRMLSSRPQIREIRHKETQINQLEAEIEHYKAEIQEPRQLSAATLIQPEVMQTAELTQ